MRHDSDIEYYRQREAAARDLAVRAGNSAISRIHLAMADEYARRIGLAERSMPQPVAAY